MERRKVYVMGEPDFSDLLAFSGLCFEDQNTRLERTVLRKDFNRQVLGMIQGFAHDKGLQQEADFSDANVDVFGITFRCSDIFKDALQRAALPYIGPFIRTELRRQPEPGCA